MQIQLSSSKYQNLQPSMTSVYFYFSGNLKQAVEELTGVTIDAARLKDALPSSTINATPCIG
jgi:hypothetical protein